MATHPQSHSHHEVTRMTIDFPAVKHKQLKATAEKLENKETLKAIEEERDIESFDRGMKSIKKDEYDSLAEVKRYLGLDS